MRKLVLSHQFRTNGTDASSWTLASTDCAWWVVPLDFMLCVPVTAQNGRFIWLTSLSVSMSASLAHLQKRMPGYGWSQVLWTLTKSQWGVSFDPCYSHFIKQHAMKTYGGVEVWLYHSSGSMKGGDFLDSLGDYRRLKKGLCSMELISSKITHITELLLMSLQKFLRNLFWVEVRMIKIWSIHVGW
jgi:hypothetical protein